MQSSPISVLFWGPCRCSKVRMQSSLLKWLQIAQKNLLTTHIAMAGTQSNCYALPCLICVQILTCKAHFSFYRTSIIKDLLQQVVPIPWQRYQKPQLHIKEGKLTEFNCIYFALLLHDLCSAQLHHIQETFGISLFCACHLVQSPLLKALLCCRKDTSGANAPGASGSKSAPAKVQILLTSQQLFLSARAPAKDWCNFYLAVRSHPQWTGDATWEIQGCV